jgi:hypothetical protein
MAGVDLALTRAARGVLAELIADPTRAQYVTRLHCSTGLSVGQIYAVLARLEAVRWLESGWDAPTSREQGWPRRPYYRLTRDGLAMARGAFAKSHAPLFRRLRPAAHPVGPDKPIASRVVLTGGGVRMIGPRPHLPARWLLAVVVLVVPAPSRDRYREEFRAELPELGLLSQVFQAGTLLVGSVSLRQALINVDGIEDLVLKKDWRCRLGRHQYMPVQDDNPEMPKHPFLRCIRCHKPKEPMSRGEAARRTTMSFIASGGARF